MDDLEYHVGSYEDKTYSPEMYVSDAALSHHCVLFGDTGTGKSRMLTHLISEQLKAGHSLVALDPKEQSIRNLLAACEAADIPPERVHVVSPAFPELVPGWNPLKSSLPLGLAVSKVADMAKTLIGDWGSRLDSIFKAGLVVLGTHGYGMDELGKLLTDNQFRAAILKRPGKTRSYERAVQYFTNQFPGAVKADKNAIPAVLNKIEKLLESDLLAAMLTAKTNTLDLSRFFDEQQVVLFHLSRAGFSLSGVSLLAGLVSEELNFLSERPPRARKVVLSLDEIGILKRYVEVPLAEIARLARESGLRLLVSGQELSVMSGHLETVLTQAEVHLYLRLNRQDAELAAKRLEGQGLPPSEEHRRELLKVRGALLYYGIIEECRVRAAAVSPEFAEWSAVGWDVRKEQRAIAEENYYQAYRRWEQLQGTGTPQEIAEAAEEAQWCYERYQEVRAVYEAMVELWFRDRHAVDAEMEKEYERRKQESQEAWDKQFTRARWTRIIQDLDKPAAGPGQLLVSVKNELPELVRAVDVPDCTVSPGYLDRLARRPGEEVEGSAELLLEEPLPSEGIFDIGEDDDTL